MVDAKLLKEIADLAPQLSDARLRQRTKRAAGHPASKAIAELERALDHTGIRVEAWFFPETELKRPASRRGQDAEGHELGYCHFEEGWRVAIRGITLVYDEGGWFAAFKESQPDKDSLTEVRGIPQPLLRASQKVRERMLPHLNDLLGLMLKKGRAELRRVKGAAATATKTKALRMSRK
ncbi:MAG: hypothetical protein NTZ09_02645 [Candidatus Hydrogenedentes bacterium]|nr:hypothetical protein [Candidatus Hydrogenedentota bacterium]